MVRSVLLLVAGAIAGAAAVYLFFGGDDSAESASTSLTTDSSTTANAVEAASTAAGSPPETGSATAIRVAAYERALEANDALDLEAMLDFKLAESDSRVRDLELSALLARLIEVDPHRAVEFAQSAFVETDLLIQTLEALANVDFDAAIIELAGISPASRQRKIAIALLDLVGNDAQRVERIYAALPSDAQPGLEFDALIARAEADPVGVLQEVLAQNRQTLLQVIMPHVAEAIVAQDPAAALTLAESISDFAMRSSYLGIVMREWAELDSEAVFAYIETLDARSILSSTVVLGPLAESDPDRLLAMIDDFPLQARTAARQAVMRAYAERDPSVALAMIEALPPGQDRQNMLRTIAQAYGRQSPDLAYTWAKSLVPPSADVVQTVLQGIAQVDSGLAIDLWVAELEEQVAAEGDLPPSFQNSMSLPVIFTLMAADNGDIARLADRLLELDSRQAQSIMGSAISMWASRDREASLSWAMANANRLDASTMRSIAQQVAEQDASRAIGMLDQLGAEQRAGWVTGVAAHLAQTDVDQAIGLIERIRDQPGYDSAFSAVVRASASVDPERAARLLQDAPQTSASDAASMWVAREWANRDPAAAGRWAVGIADAQTQARNLGTIASTWAARDADGAERWIFSLSDGAHRDAAADGYMNAAAQVGRFEPGLLEAYSSDDRRQQAVTDAILRIGRTDPEQARQLLATHVTDPATRQNLERQLFGAGSAGAISLPTDGAFLIPR